MNTIITKKKRNMPLTERRQVIKTLTKKKRQNKNN